MMFPQFAFVASRMAAFMVGVKQATCDIHMQKSVQGKGTRGSQGGVDALLDTHNE
jgi:hypothetical protein